MVMSIVLFSLLFVLSFDFSISQPWTCLSEFSSSPKFPDPLSSYTPADFNLISFGDFFHNSTGDVEGRVAVAGNVTLGGGFSIGYQIHSAGPNATDYPRVWSLVVGGDLIWTSGELFPEGNGIPWPASKEGIYVGGNIYNTPSYLASRRTGGPCSQSGCLDDAFNFVYQYYVNVSSTFAAQNPNVVAQLQNTGLFLSSEDRSASRYYLQIPDAIFNKAQYWVLNNINPAAEFIVTIQGTNNVIFSGGNFPSIPEKTVFNIPGKRDVIVENEASGSFLAPDATLRQRGGDEIGFVVVGDVEEFVETRKPICSLLVCCKYCPPPLLSSFELL